MLVNLQILYLFHFFQIIQSTIIILTNGYFNLFKYIKLHFLTFLIIYFKII